MAGRTDGRVWLDETLNLMLRSKVHFNRLAAVLLVSPASESFNGTIFTCESIKGDEFNRSGSSAPLGLLYVGAGLNRKTELWFEMQVCLNVFEP